MKLTYHPTLGLAPNATCLRKSWMRAWIEITFSLTSWPTCTVSDSSFGRLLGDVYQEVSNSDPVRATTNPFIHIRSQLYCPQKSDFSFFFYLFLLMHSQSSQEMIFHILGWFLTASFPPPTTEKSLLDTLWTSFVLSKITSFCYTRCLISLSISFSSCCLKSDPFSTLPSFVLPTFWVPSPTPMPYVLCLPLYKCREAHTCGVGYLFLNSLISWLSVKLPPCEAVSKHQFVSKA